MLKVQTNGIKTPIEAVKEACLALVLLLGNIKTKFGQEVLKAQARGDGDIGGIEDEYNF